jgi:GNAT superfamily N-acetyltransferase
MLEIQYIATDKLIPYINNSRTHSEAQIHQITASIVEFGFTNPVLIDEKGMIIAGHGRIEAAKVLGIDEVPTITLKGLTETQRKAYIIADNKLALNAGWDYHYLSHAHNNSALKYIAEINGEPVAWCSLLHFPHPIVKNMKRIHRIVVKPDYQGIGVGVKVMSEISKKYKEKGFRVSLVTSSQSFVHSLANSKQWIMTRKPSRASVHKGLQKMKNTGSANRITSSFEYVGEK